MANKFVVGLVVGIGVKWVAPYVVPVLGALVRPITQVNVKPLAKAGIKAGWLGIERGREMVSYFGETIQDALAEARHELLRDAESQAEES